MDKNKVKDLVVSGLAVVGAIVVAPIVIKVAVALVIVGGAMKVIDDQFKKSKDQKAA